MATSWRCVLVGSESLLIQCGEILEQRRHAIVAVVAGSAPVRRWAAERGIRVLPDPAALLAAGDLRPFDYLFSITNLSVLSADVLALPTRGAINFHDGPLPEYAGLNTPVWALINGEPRHGITWHVMTSVVDRGEILVRRDFDVNNAETALTLNTRCYEAGIESFELLLEKLAGDRPAGEPQTGAPKHTCGRHDRPAAASAIDWTMPAESIATLVRALDFGTYANPIGAPKVSIGGELLIVAEAVALDVPSTAPPGTIRSVTPDAITLSTSSHDLELRRFMNLEGRSLSAAEAAERYRLVPGQRFDNQEPSARERLTRLNSVLCRHEAFWLERLEHQVPVQLPHVDRAAAPLAPEYHHVDGPAFASTAVASGEPGAAMLVAVLGYLARLTDRDRFDVGFAEPALIQAIEGAAAWFATRVPLRAVVDRSLGYEALHAVVRLELESVRRRGSFATDLVARAPALRLAARTRNPRNLPVAVVLVDRLAEASAEAGIELTIAISRDGAGARWLYDARKLSADTVKELQEQFAEFAGAALGDPARPLDDLPLWSAAERARVLEEWNSTAAPVRSGVCIHRLIEEQAARTPTRRAVISEGGALTYQELDRRANQLARRLASLGVGPDVLVGLCMERSVDMMVGLLAIHKAGGAYVPLDPTYPRDRLAWMLEDSRVPVLLTQARLLDDLPKHSAAVVCLDADWPSIEAEPADSFDGGAVPENLAYVIYTSGSTGTPKGVMVEHRQVVNFFSGMDQRIGTDEPGVWLAVTSLNFDISVLELCWTLTRGFQVVIAGDLERAPAGPARGPHAQRPIDFSLFYFSSDESEAVTDKYRLLLEGAKFGDQHGFAAVWTPERHFHAFGGLYPNPAVTSAAVATITERIKIRAGSVVLPLHHPIRVAEEWALVDNLSRGRVGISFASGWQPNDFVLRPENFANNKQVMLESIETVRRLWRGEAMSFPGASGKPVEVRILPRPIQPELPFWLTSAGSVETFIAAGRIGAFVLTHLLGQSVDELIDKLAAYRKAWTEAGHPGSGHVTLMLHAFVGSDPEEVRAKVRQPLIDYLKSSVSLIKQYAWSFPAFKRRPGMDTSTGVDLQSLTDEEMDALLEHSFGRYYETSGLFGTPESCLAMVDRLKGIGVDEIACLIDFGVDSEAVLEHLGDLNQLRKLATPRRAPAGDESLAALMRRHSVTHLQCTPSMARMLLEDDEARAGLRSLQRLMLGGEAFPTPLAREFSALVSGKVMNMYGPTETTIWSSVHQLGTVDGAVPLGAPLANQEIYLLDSRLRPVPVGVPGEIVIGGAGVTRGYLHRPELTAERFVQHPFRGAAGERVYRTGDLARFRRDGTLEFLGRLDSQVKVRGYRIELGEIEAVIQGYPGIRETVMVAREDVPGDLRLVAYLVPRDRDGFRVQLLREHLRGRLPEYMVPGHFVLLDALPLTPNGKVDRKALPAPDAVAPPPSEAPYVPPATDLEEQIAGVWRDVLNLPQVGTKDNFFDLGGHSLLAVQVHRRLRESLARELSITDIFRFPTIHSLSTYLGQGVDGGTARQGTERAEGRRAAMQRRQHSSRQD